MCFPDTTARLRLWAERSDERALSKCTNVRCQRIYVLATYMCGQHIYGLSTHICVDARWHRLYVLAAHIRASNTYMLAAHMCGEHIYVLTAYTCWQRLNV